MGVAEDWARRYWAEEERREQDAARAAEAAQAARERKAGYALYVEALEVAAAVAPEPLTWARQLEIWHAMTLAAQEPAVGIQWIRQTSLVADHMTDEGALGQYFPGQHRMVVPPMVTAANVRTVLHEIGHGRDQSRDRHPFMGEVRAWEHAWEHALTWDEDATEVVREKLDRNRRAMKPSTLQVAAADRLVERMIAGGDRAITPAQIEMFRVEAHRQACDAQHYCEAAHCRSANRRAVGKHKGLHLCAPCHDEAVTDERIAWQRRRVRQLRERRA